MNKDIGIYIHIPFCVSKCFYCDFTSYCNMDDKIEKYIDSVCTEILQNIEILSQYNITTVYFGGGTPSYIDSKYIVKIMQVLKLLKKDESEFKEVTIELNPNSIQKEKITDYINSGINRFSIGLQSTHDQILKSIGRKHTYNDFKNGLEILSECGAKNISLDIIYPLPNLTLEQFNDTLDKVISLKENYNIKHISIYNLEIHPNTKLDFLLKNEFLTLPDEDEEYKMKNLLIKKLEEANFIQYEISNFSLDGYSSKHNLNYWNQGQYLGFGVSASSFFAGSRYTNTNSITDYIKNINNGISTIAEKEDLDKLDMMKEYIILKLRLKDGINTDEFMSKFGNNIFNIFKTELDYLISNNLIIHNNKNLYLSSRGKEIANFVWEKFI